MEIDELTRGILWDRLIGICDEVYQAFVKSSFSTLVREAYDAVFVLFDPKARLLAQASLGPPSFIGTSTNTIKELLARYPAHSLRAGDILATNDPWIGTGQINDLSMIRPIIEDSALLGFTGTVQHLPDVGGAHTMSGIASDIFEEGLRIPPCKIVEEGAVNEELLEIVASNVRVPSQVIGDIKAGITSNLAGERLVKKLVREYALGDLLRLSESILSKSSEVMREKIKLIPKGDYRHEINAEGYLGSESIKIACSVGVSEGDLVVNFDGTSPSVHRGLNVPYVYTNSFSRFALKCVLTPELPNNDGSAGAIQVLAPEGCILNAPSPHSTSARHITGWFVPMAIWGAISKVVQRPMIAESGTPSMVTFSGGAPDGRRFVLPIGPAIMGGSGARTESDGEIMAMPTNIARVPVEIWEKEAGGSLLVEKAALVPDSAGAGKYRGGPSTECAIVNLSSHPIMFAVTGGRTRFAAQGYFGGRPGRNHEVYINDRRLFDKGVYELNQGDKLRFVTPAGGGMYDPEGRGVDDVLGDYLSGLVTWECARNIYHVEIDKKKLKASRISAAGTTSRSHHDLEPAGQT